jgi:hypothetical protein
MLPQKRRERKALHEAGHAALALKKGMLGCEGVEITDDETGDTGSTSIKWDGLSMQFAERIRDRATIAMAGVAAEPAGLRPELESGQWIEIAKQCEDLRSDINKVRCLHWILLDLERIWSQRIVPFIAQNPKAKEDDLLGHICNSTDYGSGPSFDVLQEYFLSARIELSDPRVKRFIELAASRLLEQEGRTARLSCAECHQMWIGANN